MKIKILHCVETIGTGGVEQRRLALAELLDKSQFSQQLTCSKVLDNFDTRLERHGMKVFSIGELASPLNFGYYRRLIKVVREVRPTIIHGAVFEGVISAVVAGFICRVPIIIIEETSDPQNRSWRGHLLLRLLSVFANYVVAISPSVEAYLLDVARIPRRKVRLITNGVHVPRVISPDELQTLRGNLGLSPGDFIIGSVGRLRDFHKRFSDLIKALPSLVQSIPNVKLLIVGEGEDKAMLRKLSKELGVEGRVIFAGFHSDIAPLYRCMNVFALASHMEGFGLVVAEAMFFKLPVVATAVGGIKDIVVNGQTGILVNRHDPKAIGDAIRSIHDDPAFAARLGEAGYRRAMDNYSAPAYVKRVHNLYQEALIKKKMIRSLGKTKP